MENRRTFNHQHQAFAAAASWAQETCRQDGGCALLVPTYDDVVRMKKGLAALRAGFGVTVSLPSAWIEDLWHIWGDARRLVTPVERNMLLRKALALSCEAGHSQLKSTVGVVGFLARAAQEALPTLLMEEGNAPIGPRGEDALAVLRLYASLLEERGLIEESEACAFLARRRAAVRERLLIVDCETSACQDLLFATASACYYDVCFQASDGTPSFEGTELETVLSRLYQPDFSHPVQATGSVRFAFPEGAYAQPRLLVRHLMEMVSRLQGQDAACPMIALSAKSPMPLFEDLAEALAQRGVQVQVDDSCRVTETAFGKSWLSLMRFLDGASWEAVGAGYLEAAKAIDYCMGPFSHMRVSQARSLEGRFRGWRGQTIDDALTDMSAYTDDDYRDFLYEVSQEHFLEALASQQRWIAQQTSWPESYRLCQLSSAKKVYAVHALAEELGLSLPEALDSLQEVTVGMSCVLPVENPQAIVRIGSLSWLGSQDEGSFDAVVLCDQTAEAYPLKDDQRAEDLFLENWDACRPRKKSEKLHRVFYQALAAAKREATVVRCLHGVNTEELRPSALLEELVDCYRSDPQNPDEIHKVTGLPDSLMPFSSTLGEEAVSADLAMIEADAVPKVIIDKPHDVLPEHARSRVVLPSALFDPPRAALSPSAIESYLECPRKWFTERRLGLKSLEADFDVRAFGSFAHAVLEQTHNAMRQAGLRRVTKETLRESIALLDQTFDMLFEQEQHRIANDALVPLSQPELLRVKRLRQTLEDYLRWEEHLLPEYAPYGAELVFGEDNPVEYAGVQLRGRLDRVDVDPYGHAAVIDYKTSISSLHAFREKDAQAWALPRKVQAVVYAQVVRRKLGLMPTAALYVSYAKPSVMGLYDDIALNAQELPGIRVEQCSTHQFNDMLDRCEEAIAPYLERMQQGLIEPQPLDGKACTYCPVVDCPRRCS